jgi:hypothetical protein
VPAAPCIVPLYRLLHFVLPGERDGFSLPQPPGIGVPVGGTTAGERTITSEGCSAVNGGTGREVRCAPPLVSIHPLETRAGDSRSRALGNRTVPRSFASSGHRVPAS